MKKMKLPAFGETNFYDNQLSRNSRVVLLEEQQPDSFRAYCDLAARSGYTCREQFSADHRSFAAYEKDGAGLFINFFANTAQLQLVTEDKCAYFTYEDKAGAACVRPRITQVKLSDYGLSDVIRLSDGRLMIIDGANVYEQDIDNLFARLKKDSPFEKPVIAAWLMTHPHSDHFFCFFPFMKKYGQEVVIEKFFFHFPEGDDLEHYPKLSKDGTRFAQWSGIESITGGEIVGLFRRDVAALGVPVYTPHTGQTYQIGDAKLCFYGSMDDSIHRSQNINATSVMFSMELGGQRIFITGDGSFSDTYLAQRYGEELKCDILQVPHHGFGCGTEQGQIDGYRCIAPRVCLLPVEKGLAYTTFTSYREGTNYLMTRMQVEEMLTGEKENTLELPYTPDPAGVYQLQRDYQRGRSDAGARTWVFTELNTGDPEDLWFSVLNTIYIPAELTVEIYLENMQKQTRHFKITGPRLGVFRVNCLLTPEDDPELVNDPNFLEMKDIPRDTRFAVRFMSSLPVVISHRNHQPAYYSDVI